MRLKTAVEAHGRELRSRAELSQPAFVQLFNLAADAAETTDVAARYPDKIPTLQKVFESQVHFGRSTPGAALANDRDNISAFPAVPAYVWQGSQPSRP